MPPLWYISETFVNHAWAKRHTFNPSAMKLSIFDPAPSSRPILL